MIRYFMLVAVVISTSQSQTVSGSINGTPIPNDALNPTTQELESAYMMRRGRLPNEQELSTTLQDWRCRHFQNLLHHAAASELKQRLYTEPATDSELAAARADQAKIDQKTGQAARKATLTGFSLVYDQGQDPTAVYHNLNLSQYLTLNIWLGMVHSHQDPANRQKLTKFYDALDANPKPPDSELKKAIEEAHFDDAVDQFIASQDATFSQYLSEQNSVRTEQDMHIHIGPMNASHMEYLKQHRQAFWQAQEAKVDVYLTDPSIGKSCGLPQFK